VKKVLNAPHVEEDQVVQEETITVIVNTTAREEIGIAQTEMETSVAVAEDQDQGEMETKDQETPELFKLTRCSWTTWMVPWRS